MARQAGRRLVQELARRLAEQFAASSEDYAEGQAGPNWLPMGYLKVGRLVDLTGIEPVTS